MNAYTKYFLDQVKVLKFLISDEGQELQLCLVAQGYERILFEKLMCLYGSGFIALDLIKVLRDKVKDELDEWQMKDELYICVCGQGFYSAWGHGWIDLDVVLRIEEIIDEEFK